MAVVIFIFLVLLAGLGGGAYYVYSRKLHRAKAIERGLKMVPVQIHLPPQSSDTTAGGRDLREVMRETTSQAKTLYDLLAGTATAEGFKSRFYGQRHIGLELVASGGLIYFYAAVPVALVSVVEKAIQTAYPGARLEEAEDHNIFNRDGRLAATMGGELVLRAEAGYPIATYEELERDPMNALITTLSALGKGDGAAVQVMLRPAGTGWVARSKKVADSIRTGKPLGLAFKPADVLKAALNHKGGADKPAEAPHVMSSLEQALVERIEKKTRETGFEVLVRLVVSTQSVATSQQLMRDLSTAFALFESPGSNGFKFLPAVDVQGLVTAFILRFFPPELRANVLNTSELATLFHLPDAQFVPTANVTRLASKEVDGPVSLPASGLLFGYNEFRGVKKEIRLSFEDRRRHTYILGQTGTGKSTMLENLISQDMRTGNGFAFIDPHGDSAEKLLSLVPKERAEDVIYFNPADTDYPLGLNLFEFDRPEQKDFIVQETINMLYKLYDPGHTGIIGPRYEHWYRNAALTLMSDPNGSTFIEIPKVFTDTDYLKQKFRYLKDPTVIDFWTKEMGQTSDYHKSEMLGWFVSKFGAFQNNEMMRNIIGQTKSSFNLRDVMDNKKILIVNLSKGRIGELNSQLLGMIFVIKFQAAAMARADMPEAERNDFALYVDEFQNFSTDSFASILSEARKYRLNLIVANQFIGQLTPEIRDAVFGNIGTIIAHRMGPEDAEFMTKQFAPVFDASDLVNIPNYHSVIRLMNGGLPSQPFTVANAPYQAGGNPEFGTAIKQLSAAKFGAVKAKVEADIAARMSGVAPAETIAPAPVAAVPTVPTAVVPTAVMPAPEAVDVMVPAAPVTPTATEAVAASAAAVTTPAEVASTVAVPAALAPTAVVPTASAVTPQASAVFSPAANVVAPQPATDAGMSEPAVTAAPAPLVAPARSNPVVAAASNQAPATVSPAGVPAEATMPPTITTPVVTTPVPIAAAAPSVPTAEPVVEPLDMVPDAAVTSTNAAAIPVEKLTFGDITGRPAVADEVLNGATAASERAPLPTAAPSVEPASGLEPEHTVPTETASPVASEPVDATIPAPGLVAENLSPADTAGLPEGIIINNVSTGSVASEAEAAESTAPEPDHTVESAPTASASALPLVLASAAVPAGTAVPVAPALVVPMVNVPAPARTLEPDAYASVSRVVEIKDAPQSHDPLAGIPLIGDTTPITVSEPAPVNEPIVPDARPSTPLMAIVPPVVSAPAEDAPAAPTNELAAVKLTEEPANGAPSDATATAQPAAEGPTSPVAPETELPPVTMPFESAPDASDTEAPDMIVKADSAEADLAAAESLGLKLTPPPVPTAPLAAPAATPALTVAEPAAVANPAATVAGVALVAPASATTPAAVTTAPDAPARAAAPKPVTPAPATRSTDEVLAEVMRAAAVRQGLPEPAANPATPATSESEPAQVVAVTSASPDEAIAAVDDRIDDLLSTSLLAATPSRQTLSLDAAPAAEPVAVTAASVRPAASASASAPAESAVITSGHHRLASHAATTPDSAPAEPSYRSGGHRIIPAPAQPASPGPTAEIDAASLTAAVTNLFQDQPTTAASSSQVPVSTLPQAQAVEVVPAATDLAVLAPAPDFPDATPVVPAPAVMVVPATPSLATAGSVIQPIVQPARLPERPVAPLQAPPHLAKGEVFVDANGNVIIGE